VISYPKNILLDILLFPRTSTLKLKSKRCWNRQLSLPMLQYVSIFHPHLHMVFIFPCLCLFHKRSLLKRQTTYKQIDITGFSTVSIWSIIPQNDRCNNTTFPKNKQSLMCFMPLFRPSLAHWFWPRIGPFTWSFIRGRMVKTSVLYHEASWSLPARIGSNPTYTDVTVRKFASLPEEGRWSLPNYIV
jgi:hypothetical protein